MSGRAAPEGNGGSAGRKARRLGPPPQAWLPRLIWHYRKLDPVAQIGLFVAVGTMIFAAMPVIMPPAPEPRPPGAALAQAGETAADPNKLKAKLTAVIATYEYDHNAVLAERSFRGIIDESDSVPEIQSEARRWHALMIKQSDPKSAMDEFGLAIKLNPNNAAAWTDRDTLLSQVGIAGEGTKPPDALSGDTTKVAKVSVESGTTGVAAVNSDTAAPVTTAETLALDESSPITLALRGFALGGDAKASLKTLDMVSEATTSSTEDKEKAKHWAVRISMLIEFRKAVDSDGSDPWLWKQRGEVAREMAEALPEKDRSVLTSEVSHAYEMAEKLISTQPKRFAELEPKSSDIREAVPVGKALDPANPSLVPQAREGG